MSALNWLSSRHTLLYCLSRQYRRLLGIRHSPKGSPTECIAWPSRHRNTSIKHLAMVELLKVVAHTDKMHQWAHMGRANPSVETLADLTSVILYISHHNGFWLREELTSCVFANDKSAKSRILNIYIYMTLSWMDSVWLNCKCNVFSVTCHISILANLYSSTYFTIIY